MNSTFIITVIYLIITTNCYCQQKTDLQKGGLKGNVKTQKYSEYSVTEKFGELQKDKLTRSFSWKFNKNGNYETSEDSTKYYYNLKNRLTKRENFGNTSNQGYYYTFLYDERGNNIEKTEFSFNDKITYKGKMKYNQKNLIVEYNTYNSDGDLTNKWIYKYDIKGNKIISNMYSSNGDLYATSNMKYDERGNCIEEETRMPVELTNKVTTKYNSRNHKVSYQSEYTGVSMQKYNSINTYEYKYDNKGNIVSELEYRKGKAELLTIYEIEYYPTAKSK